jgi:hypothetical protein
MLVIRVGPYVYNSASGRLSLSWNASEGKDLGLRRNALEVRFEPNLTSITDTEVFDIFCGCLLPHFALRDPEVKITGLPGAAVSRQEFWTWYLEQLGIDSSVQFDSEGLEEVADEPVTSGSENHRVGLFFGGGVESLALLRLILHVEPYLMTVEGPAFMNSDYAHASIKAKLQQKLAERYGLAFLRVWTDARTLFPATDEYVNKYITGSLFYYTLLPLMRRHGVGVSYLGCELEYALYELPFNLSLHARFTHKVSRAPNPPLLSPLNALPKVDLLDDLYRGDPELCSFLYSCFQNTALRWCGVCGKCKRISAYCEAIGIPRSLIGMQEGIAHEREQGELTRGRYWDNLDRYRESSKGRRDSEEPKSLVRTDRNRPRWLGFPRIRRSA